MYHIPNDKRAEKSANAITAALMTCLKQKDLSQITVTDVWKSSNISRATFYRLFDNIVDVLVYKSDLVFEQLAVKLQSFPNPTLEDATILVIETGMDHSELIGAVLSAQRTDILYQSIMKQKACFLSIFAKGKTSELSDYIIRSIFLEMCMFLEIWVENGKTESPHSLYMKMKETIHLLSECF
ncbi:MAG: hypothetical protein LUE89_09040 [Clostridiales bacterium]|nr:hypothetical protein [Clostridiales bacterium]